MQFNWVSLSVYKKGNNLSIFFIHAYCIVSLPGPHWNRYLGKGWFIIFSSGKVWINPEGSGGRNWGLFWSTESRLFQSKFVHHKSSCWSPERVDDRPWRGVQRSFSVDERRSAEERSGQAVRLRLAVSSQQEHNVQCTLSGEVSPDWRDWRRKMARRQFALYYVLLVLY